MPELNDPCTGCADRFFCYDACYKTVQWEELGKADRYQGKYKPKGIELLSYQDSRVTKRSIDTKELNFDE